VASGCQCWEVNPVGIHATIIAQHHRVDGHRLQRHRYAWQAPHKTFWVSPVTPIECPLFLPGYLPMATGKDLFRVESSQATVMVLEVVPIEVTFTPAPGMRYIVETASIIRLVLLSLEVTFAERVVIAHPGTTMTARHIEYIASESSFYRVLREVQQGHRRRRSNSPLTVSKPEGFKATGPNQLWSWNITYLASSIRGSFYRLYLVLDIFSRKIVGWEVHENGSAEHASLMIRKACLAEGIHWDGLALHDDNGGPMKGATMLATLQNLGIVPSFSRPSVSDDNPYSESMLRTLKYTPAYPSKPFESIEAARQWVHHFLRWYNDEHRHSAIRYVTPRQRHRSEDNNLPEQRKAVYERARQQNPQRWSGMTRSWNPVEEVWQNPPKENQAGKEQESKAE
jgi:putative transposase